MERQRAEDINRLMNQITEMLEKSLHDFPKDEAAQEERAAYATAIRNILGTILLDIKTPIYQQYPDLSPDSLKDLFEGS